MFLNPDNRGGPKNVAVGIGGFGDDGDGDDDEMLTSTQRSASQLPIYAMKRNLLKAVKENDVVILIGETGSGKTTQPQYLAQAGWADGGRVICCTQPRRIAAISVAQRVAKEMGVQLGDIVGYSVRFDEQFDRERTRIKYMTDGSLVREAMIDPYLSQYSVVVVDEVHERQPATDLVLGLLCRLRRLRPQLKLIVSSATMDANEMREFFERQASQTSPLRCATLHVDGRSYPVDVCYAVAPVADYIQATISTVLAIHRAADSSRGDILVFLTGADECRQVVRALDDDEAATASRGRRLLALPLYGALAPSQQMQVFQPTPSNVRKVVVATNVAEASVTIDEIRYVVDCGFEKLRCNCAQTNADSLAIVAYSKASATQRAGRAGRVEPGVVYRLYTQATYSSLTERQPPAMTRINIVDVVLQLKALGIDDIASFPFISPPSPHSLARALETLRALGAVDAAARLTSSRGLRLAELPLPPPLGVALLAAADLVGAAMSSASRRVAVRTLRVVVDIVAVASGSPVWQFSSGSGRLERAQEAFGVREGDHMTYYNVLYEFERQQQSQRWAQEQCVSAKALKMALKVRAQLYAHLKRFNVDIVGGGGGSSDAEDELVSVGARRALLSGLFINVAYFNRQEQVYRTIVGGRGGTKLYLHPTSVLRAVEPSPSLVFFNELSRGDDRTFMMHVSVVDDRSWLLECAGDFYSL